MMILFFLGIVEMLIVTSWTKLVTDNKVMVSGLVTIINVLIWYYVLETIVSDLSNWLLVISYSLGCALGTMGCMLFFQKKENSQAS